MEDSFEDYLKFSKNTKNDGPATVSKDLQATANRKKECDMRAMKIVEFSIEGKLRPEVFIRCLPFINQSHYQDIVEERAISKLCGYSVCGKRIPDMPKKQYFISTKSNKVYDITDRKNYCSNFCYKASIHIKKQVDNTPLWLRKVDDIPEYNLLPNTERGLPGEFVDQGVPKPTTTETSFTSVSSFTEISLDDYIANTSSSTELRSKSRNKTKGFKKSSRLKQSMQTIKETDIEVVDENEPVQIKSENDINIEKSVASVSKRNSIISLPSIEENVESEEKLEEIKSEDNIKCKPAEAKKTVKKSKKSVSKSQPPRQDVENHLNKCINEWLTLDSYIFLHGEEKIKAVLTENKLEHCFDSLKIAELQMEQQLRYINICKRLHLQEMADEKFDKALLDSPRLKPVPNYKKLKEENKDLELKVKAYYTGGVYEREDNNYSTKNKDDTGEEGPPAVLPLVDIKSQNALRRKIFLNSINKTMQQLLQSLRISYYTAVLSDLQMLVKTFKLKSDNIVFKPVIWNYIAVTLLNMMSLRDENIKEVLEERRSKEYMDALLCSFPNKNSFISNVLKNLDNIELFVESYITSKDS